MDLTALTEEALRVQSSGFVETVDTAISVLSKETGHIGNLTIINHLVKLEPSGEALVVGDLHGDLESLVFILQESRFLDKMEKNRDSALIFLGDYGDRGEKSAEVYFMVLKLKLAFPAQVIMLRGNHEGPKNLVAEPHDLPLQFQGRFGIDWQLAYEKIQDIWPYLYNAVIVESCYLMVHGGVSPEITSLQCIADAQENSNEALLEDLLWSDPDDYERGVSFSPRGAGKLFGKKVTLQVLSKLNVKILVRGHEPCSEGFKINHDGKVLTLFSRKGAPYFNVAGAYLQVPLSQQFEDACQLVPWIHRF